LVVFQFTLAVVLLSGAGLMMRSFLLAQDEFSQLQGERILTAWVSLPSTRYPNPEDKRQFFDKVRAQLESLPGAEVVAFVSNHPGGGSAGWRFELEDHPIHEAERRPAAAGVVASSSYFRLLGIPLIRGRDFEDYDGLSGKEAAIVSEQFVSRHFPNQNPIGKRLRLFTRENQPRPWMTIVGVVPGFR